MGAIASAFSSAFRDYSTDGVPASGIHSVAKSDARALGTTIEAQLTGLLTGGSTLAAADGSASTPGITFSADLNTGIYRISTDKLGIATAGTLRVAVLADGKVGVGTTNPVRELQVYNSSNARIVCATDDRNDGFFVTPALGMYATSSNVYFGTVSNHDLRMGTNGSASFVIAASGASIYSESDNATSLGTSLKRWSVVYAVTGSINTSDERTKDWRGALQPVEIRAALEIAREIGVFRFRDEIARKGLDGARDHIGVRAQRVWGIMAKHGLVEPIGDDGRPSGACRYAFLCYDEWEAEVALDPIYSSRPSADGSRRVIRTEEKVIRDAGSLYGIRPDELNMFLMAALFSAVMPEE